MSSIYLPSTAIEPAPSFAGRTMCRWRSQPRVRRDRARSPQGTVVPSTSAAFSGTASYFMSSPATPEEDCPLQLVKTGNAKDDYSFTLCKENLDRVLSKVPDGMEVSVVSVVGAFRTGKSFLLSFFLRFLKNGSDDDMSEAWMTAEGPSLLEGNRNVDATEGGGEKDSDKPRSFAWRGGVERMTTGIWMWSEPFVRRTEDGKDVAVLLVDTQGMFDNETSMGLTACIFAVSTLASGEWLSSCQIYNVEKRIQEDNLQQLALFSEYGRMALTKEHELAIEEENDAEKRDSAYDLKRQGSLSFKDKNTAGVNSAVRLSAKARADIQVRRNSVAAAAAKAAAPGAGGEGGDNGDPKPATESKTAAPSQDRAERPFQRLEFLVRDWQNYEDEDLPTQKLQDEMDDYLVGVINDKGVKDLRDTREQITACFEKIACFGLTHPGFEVVKKNYKGEVDKIQPSFRRLLNVYARHIFGELLEPKRINGRNLTAPELRTYATAYVELFHNGAHFPAARSLLEATAGAHNGNAKHVAFRKYKAEMDQRLGPKAAGHLSSEAFGEHERRCREGAFGLFDAMATMGRRSEILRVRELLLEELDDAKSRYGDVNTARNPFNGSEYWVIPMSIAFVSYVARWIADLSCSAWSDTCRKTSDTLGFIYFAMVLVLLVMFRQRLKGVVVHFGNLFPVLIGNVKDQLGAINK